MAFLDDSQNNFGSVDNEARVLFIDSCWDIINPLVKVNLNILLLATRKAVRK